MSGVQFHKKGPIIPYDLLRSQERGDTVFLCGAGVSMGAGLPDFYSLVEGIYRRLGEDFRSHFAEAEGMVDRRHSAPDRTLFALKRRLGPIGEERIRNALIDELATGNQGTSAHYDLLRLSRSRVHSRLITTNFDTLFERAWYSKVNAEIDSWAASGMPGPGSADFRGVFHLHGRLADSTLPTTLARSELVLNSAEFGDAYLRSGWASRYLYDLLLHADVVIVGYSLSDPPTRYLFEALSADRERFQFKNLYAIAPATKANREQVGDLWDARGAIPLLYDSTGNHDALYSTINGWATYADNPTSWAKNQASRILSKSPRATNDEDWRRIDWIFSRGDADRIIADVNPSAQWVGPLASRKSRIDADVSLGRWIERRLRDRKTITEVLRDARALDATACGIIDWALYQRPALTPAVRQCWRLILDQVRRKPQDDRLHLAVRAVVSGDTDQLARSAICKCLTPRPILSPRHKFPGYRPRAKSLKALADVTFEAPDDSEKPTEIRDAWPSELDYVLLRDLDDALQSSLAYARELGAERSTVFDIPSISEHPQNEIRHGYNALARTAILIWERLVKSDPGAGKHFAERWRLGPFELQQRMWLHSLTEPTAYSGEEMGKAVLELSDEMFWGARFRRELMRILTLRWADFPKRCRTRIEARIIKGDPR